MRTHDGDRRLNSYEVHVLISARSQPREDEALVPDATLDDLDPELVDALIKRLRATRGRVFTSATDKEFLLRSGVTARVDGQVGVTLAGLLALGLYPQQFFPQLNITFTVVPTVDGRPLSDGTRFLDNQSIDGPIPLMMEEALVAMRRNMRRRSVVIGLGREDHWA